MFRHKPLFALVALALVLAARAAVALPPPPSAPFTLWNFLGIPQGLNKIRDATLNAAGNHPGLERLPPLKAIADPANLESPVPAIKAAAEIKAEADLAPQKIKALKYLSRIGCDNKNYPQVKEALMGALEDPTEEVRYQAVLAIQDAITQHCGSREDEDGNRGDRRRCRRCNRGDDEECNCDCDTACCCDEDMVLKLAAIADERDDDGCYLELSERVREAAKAAMCSCCPGRGPIAPTEETPDEPVPEGVPTPTPPTLPEAPPEERSAQRAQSVLPDWLFPQQASPAVRPDARSRLLAPPAAAPRRGSSASASHSVLAAAARHGRLVPVHERAPFQRTVAHPDNWPHLAQRPVRPIATGTIGATRRPTPSKARRPAGRGFPIPASAGESGAPKELPPFSAAGPRALAKRGLASARQTAHPPSENAAELATRIDEHLATARRQANSAAQSTDDPLHQRRRSRVVAGPDDAANDETLVDRIDEHLAVASARPDVAPAPIDRATSGRSAEARKKEEPVARADERQPKKASQARALPETRDGASPESQAVSTANRPAPAAQMSAQVPPIITLQSALTRRAKEIDRVSYKDASPVRHTVRPVRDCVTATVASIDYSDNTVQLNVKQDAYLLVGDRLKVTHEFLLKEVTLGYLEVVTADSRGIWARPVGTWDIRKVARGDRATFKPDLLRLRQREASKIKHPGFARGQVADR